MLTERMRALWRKSTGIDAPVRRIARALDSHHVSLVAAGVAFYSFLAIIPALAALVSVYGLVFDADDVVAQVKLLRTVAPDEVVTLLSTEAERLIHADSSALGLGIAGGMLVAIWSATKGARALIQAMNIIRDGDERRSFVQIYWLSAVFTIIGLLVMVAALALLVTLPALVRWLPASIGGTVVLLRWAVVFLVVLLAIGALYRFTACNRTTRWISAGTLVATGLWLLVSWLFQLFMEHVATLSASFGSVSTVAIFLLWLYVSALSLLIGAEVDALRAANGSQRRESR